MRPALSALRSLLLALALPLVVAGAAEANPWRRQYVVPYSPAPVYTPGVRVASGVYVFPQVNTAPSYYPAYPFGYAPGVYGGYVYNAGYNYSSFSPYWGGSYYYSNPSFYYWYRIR